MPDANSGLVQLQPTGGDLIAQLANQYGNIQALPAIQHSEILANAIRAMQANPPTLRTQGSLWSNLAANAILQFARNRSDRALEGVVQGGINARLNPAPLPGQADYDASQANQNSQPAPDGSQDNSAPTAGGPQIAPNNGAQDLPASFRPANGAATIGPSVTTAAQSAGVPATAVAAVMAALTAQQGHGAQPSASVGPPPPPITDAPSAAGYNVGDAVPSAAAGDAFDRFLPFWAKWEGAPGHRDVDGGADYYGLDTRSNPDLAANPPQSLQAAAPLLRDRVWNASGAAQIAQTNPALAIEHADTFGLSNHIANMALQGSGGDVNKYMAIREAGLQALVAANPAKFGPVARGWANRSNALAAYVAQMGPAGAGQGQPGAAGSQGPPGTPGGPPAPIPAASQGAPPQPGPANANPASSAIAPQPFPIQPSQFAELKQLHELAQQYPQLYMGQYQTLYAQLRDQASTPEPLEVGRPNDAGQVPVTGKLSGRFYGWRGGPDSGAIVTAGPRMTGDGQGGFAPVRGTQWADVPGGGPNAIEQRNQGTGEVAFRTNPAVAPPQPGQAFGPGGQLTNLPTWTPDVGQKMRTDLLSSDAYQSYETSNAAWKAMISNAGTQNGMSGYALRDTFARVINPGAVARVGTIQAIKDSPDIPDQLKTQLLSLSSGGVPPQVAQQILDAALPFAQANYQNVARINSSNMAIAPRHGLDPQDVGVPLDAPPSRYVIGSPGQGRPSSPSAAADVQASVANARAALSRGVNANLVRQRLQAAGINPSAAGL